MHRELELVLAGIGGEQPMQSAQAALVALLVARAFDGDDDHLRRPAARGGCGWAGRAQRGPAAGAAARAIPRVPVARGWLSCWKLAGGLCDSGLTGRGLGSRGLAGRRARAVRATWAVSSVARPALAIAVTGRCRRLARGAGRGAGRRALQLGAVVGPPILVGQGQLVVEPGGRPIVIPARLKFGHPPRGWVRAGRRGRNSACRTARLGLGARGL